MTDRKIQTRIEDIICTYYEKNWPEKEAGAAYVLTCWPTLFRSGLEELAGQFSKGELAVILESMAAVVLRPDTAGRQLLPAVREGIARDRLNEKWKVKSRAFLDRLTSLTRFQTAVLELWAASFRRARSGPKAIETYAQQLV